MAQYPIDPVIHSMNQRLHSAVTQDIHCLFCYFPDCGSIASPEDGSVSYSSGNTLYESVATFSCNTGYTLSSTTTRTCQANSIWSNADPVCIINGLLDY